MLIRKSAAPFIFRLNIFQIGVFAPVFAKLFFFSPSALLKAIASLFLRLIMQIRSQEPQISFSISLKCHYNSLVKTLRPQSSIFLHLPTF